MKTKWQNIFLDAGIEKGLGDLSMMIGVVSDLLSQERQRERERIAIWFDDGLVGEHDGHQTAKLIRILTESDKEAK